MIESAWKRWVLRIVGFFLVGHIAMVADFTSVIPLQLGEDAVRGSFFNFVRFHFYLYAGLTAVAGLTLMCWPTWLLRGGRRKGLYKVVWLVAIGAIVTAVTMFVVLNVSLSGLRPGS